jgi:hypothetical protein
MLINNPIDYSDLNFRDENNDDHLRIFGKKQSMSIITCSVIVIFVIQE